MDETTRQLIHQIKYKMYKIRVLRLEKLYKFATIQGRSPSFGHFRDLSITFRLLLFGSGKIELLDCSWTSGGQSLLLVVVVRRAAAAGGGNAAAAVAAPATTAASAGPPPYGCSAVWTGSLSFAARKDTTSIVDVPSKLLFQRIHLKIVNID